jgi:LmbE family N-acetylglucosaminyl deacetylase
MFALRLPDPGRPLQILCLGAHSDDPEIGCGGTMLRLAAERQVIVHWVVWGCSPIRGEEARRSAAVFLDGAVSADVRIHAFRDGFFPYVGGELKDAFENLKRDVSPDLIFTHRREDLHQDHRLINQLTWNTFRDHLILEYEIPKYDGDLGAPNVFVSLDETVVERKIRQLVDVFATQRDKRWFTDETFRGLLRIRGIEAGTRYAEGFFCRKSVVEM